MRSLLDVSVLLALMDVDHADHERVHAWIAPNLADGWATCALTENGFVRILSQPKYPNSVSVAEAIGLLRSATSVEGCDFWDCDLSLVGDVVLSDRLLGHRQVTDSYLLALAVRHGGRFVTLDTHIDPRVVQGATPERLVVI